jgi:type I restriction enzyme S subunit
MNNDFLFEHFATLATAPEGIAHLRELILQLAVQGKLGMQDAGDEPASVAVDAFFRKNKHLKKKHFVNIGENSRLPEGWISITLGNIGQWALGTGFPISIQGHTDKPILFCKVSDMNLPGNEKWIKTTNHTIDEEIKNQYNIKIHSKGTVIFPKIGGAIATNKRRIISRLTAIDNNCLGITPNDFCSTDWLFLILTSIDFTQYQSGTSIPALNQGTLAEIVTSLPPLAEQNRIVAKVDRFMMICDELEARQNQERAGCLKLGTASLAGLQNAESPEEFGRQWTQVCDAFDLILDCPENVAVLRQTVLQLAVQGRMETHDPIDEPANKLVEMIRNTKERLVKEGKIKPEKSLDLVNSIDTTFTIPKGWTLISLHELGIFTGGFTPSTGKDSYWNGDIPWVSPKDVKSKYILDSELKITQSALDNNRLHMIPPESIIIVARSGILKRTLPVAITKIECTVNQDIKVIIPYLPIITEYLYLLLKGYEQFILKKLVKGGMTVQSLKYDEFEYQLFPLPPLAEQHRIVARVDALMALCDALESRLKERAGVQGKYANAIVNQMVGGV